MSMVAKEVNVTNQAQITVANDGTNSGGNLNINANSILLKSGGGITASTVSDEGGNITFNLKDSLGRGGIPQNPNKNVN